MKLYLARHGDSLSKEIDPERSLSDQGHRELTQMVAFTKALQLPIQVLLHSGKLRAQQTAYLLAQSFRITEGIRARTGLDPLDPVKPLCDEIQEWEKDVLIVGHLPFLSLLVSRLVIGDESKALVNFTPGSLLCLKQLDDLWILEWMLQPDFFLD